MTFLVADWGVLDIEDGGVGIVFVIPIASSTFCKNSEEVIVRPWKFERTRRRGEMFSWIPIHGSS
eukprot:427222-Amorphochlora_amoeboformis.AAC.1